MIKYLLFAYQEYQKVKGAYVHWFRAKLERLGEQTSQIPKEDLAQMEVPEVQVQFLQDEGEIKEEGEEW